MKNVFSLFVVLSSIPALFRAQSSSLEAQLNYAIKEKKATIGIAVIIDGKDTVTINNNVHYPLMSVVKFHQALELVDHMERQKQSMRTMLTIKEADLKKDTYSPLRDKHPQGEFEISIAELLKYTLQQSDNNACDILFQYQGGTKAVNDYIHSLGVSDCNISVTESSMHQDINLCYQNWSTPLAAVKLLDIFLREPLSANKYKDFIYQTMLKCEPGQDRLAAPLLNKEGIKIGHKTGTGPCNSQGKLIACNDIGFVLLPSNHSYTIAVFIKDSEEDIVANSNIIAEISRIVYEYVTTQYKVSLTNNEDMKNLESYTLACKWVKSYEDPIKLKKGEEVIIDLAIETDPEWKGWVWCVASNERAGWVPMQILNVSKTSSGKQQIATISENYSAYELSVEQGEVVSGTKCLNGWLWCRKEDSTEEGWIPIKCLNEI